MNILSCSGVYKITNTKTGNFYIGSAAKFSDRFKSHKCALRRKGKSPPKLQAVWDRDGEDAFTFEPIIVCEKKDVLMYEQIAITALKPKYNTREIAHSNLGVRFSPEVNAKKGRARTSITYQGVTGGVGELARKFGVAAYQVSHRLKRGWTVEEAFEVPKMAHRERGLKGVSNRPKPAGKFTAFGTQGTLDALVEKYSPEGVNASAVSRRVSHFGWTIERALTTPPVDDATRGKNASRSHRKNEGAHREAFGVRASLVELVEKFSPGRYPLVQRRLVLGWTLERALTQKSRYEK